MKLFIDLMKVFFIRAKDTKWIVLMTSIVITMVSLLYGVGDQIIYSYASALKGVGPDWDFALKELNEEQTEYYSNPESFHGAAGKIGIASGQFEMKIEGADAFAIQVVACDEKAMDLFRMKIAKGQAPQTDSEILITEAWNKNLEKAYQIGDRVHLKCGSYVTNQYEDYEFQICGIIDSSNTEEYDYTLFGALSLEAGKQLSMEIYGEEKGIVLVKGVDDSFAAYSNLVENLPQSTDVMITQNGARVELQNNAVNYDSFAKTFHKLGLFIAILSFAMLYNLLQISIGEKIRKIGMLRCVGMDKGQWAAFWGMCALSYVLLSGIVGLVFYQILERLFGELILHKFMDAFDTGFTMSWALDYSCFLKCLLVVLAVFGVAFFFAVRKCMKMSPLEAIGFVEESAKTKVSAATRRKKEPLISFLGRRNLSRNRSRSFYTAFTFFASALLLLTSVNIFLNVDIKSKDQLRKSNLYDLEFYGDTENAVLPKEVVEELGTLMFVDQIEPEYMDLFTYWLDLEQKRYAEVRVYSDVLFEDLCLGNKVEVEDLQKPLVFLYLRGENEETQTPSNVTLYDLDGGRKDVEIDGVFVLDYYQDYGVENGSILIMNEAAGKELYGAYGYNRLLVKTENPDEVRTQIKEVLSEQGYQLYCNSLSDMQDEATDQLMALAYVAVYILLCIGFMTLVNMFCNLNINIRLRKREYGILSAMGMEKSRIAKLILYETANLAQVALLLAMVVAMLVSLPLVSQVNESVSVWKVFLFTVVNTMALYGLIWGMSYLVASWRYRPGSEELFREE